MASVTLRISEEEKELLVTIAKEEDLSLSQVIRRAIKQYLEARDNK